MSILPACKSAAGQSKNELVKNGGMHSPLFPMIVVCTGDVGNTAVGSLPAWCFGPRNGRIATKADRSSV